LQVALGHHTPSPPNHRSSLFLSPFEVTVPVKPITPAEVSSEKLASLPDEVIEAFNELIFKNWDGFEANIRQREVVALIIQKMHLTEKDEQKVFDNHWLDVEEVFQKAGWRVEFDKPGYNETYQASFTFKKKTIRGGKHGADS
jgi:hypothetical protein